MLTLVPKPDQGEPPRSPLGPLDPIWTAAVLLAVALLGWIVMIERMQGMDAGPGTSLGTLGWFVGIWVTMMAGMMLPSVEPTVLLFTRVAQQRRRQGPAAFAPTWSFVASYLAVWTVYGLLAYGLYRLVDGIGFGFLAWDRAGPAVAGAAIAVAGVYELTPVKGHFLERCRNPFHALFFEWRGGGLGAVRMGAEHGGHCVGCCFGLMVVLFALGVTSLAWMAAIAAVIFVEKVFVFGARFRRPLAVALIALGIWVAVAPGSVPALAVPDGAPAMQMG
jgi:predicted metal-binding membrane protein